MNLDTIDFKKNSGLIPAIIQDEKTGVVYMLGYMNKAALEKTLATGVVCFWSRRRKTLWTKGETSKNTLRVKDILLDCDNDTILVKVVLQGTHVCHTGSVTCFQKKLMEETV